MKRRGFVALLIALFFDPLRSAALAICNPALVRLQQKPRRELVQVRAGKSPQLGHYFIQWYGHSSFLIHSGSQTKIVADPNFNVTPGIQADAVTVSNDHFTHNNTGAVTGDPVILRGITFRQTWNPIRTSVKDITIIDTEGANKLTRVTANTVRQIDAVLESFTGASLSALVGRYLRNGDGGGPSSEEPPSNQSG